MSKFIREFESREAIITIVTHDYIDFTVYEERYNSDCSTKPRTKKEEFNQKVLDCGWNSETGMSRFLAKRYGYTNVYSLNDFREI
jgi:hypothetical protein